MAQTPTLEELGIDPKSIKPLDPNKGKYAKKRGFEDDAVEEVTKKYDDLLAYFILIATSPDYSQREKIGLINKKVAEYKQINKYFAGKKAQQAYNLGTKAAADAISEKKSPFSGAEKKQISLFEQEINLELDKQLSIYAQNAKKLAAKYENAKLKESKLGAKNATPKRAISAKKSVKELYFLDSRGRRLTSGAMLRVAVGDKIWETMFEAERTFYLKDGLKYAIHVSVLDERTTDICNALHGTVRDLENDQLPPMHFGCRSEIEIINP